MAATRPVNRDLVTFHQIEHVGRSPVFRQACGRRVISTHKSGCDPDSVIECLALPQR